MTEKHNPSATPPIFWIPLFNLGFRIFFLAAGIFSVITMSMWLGIYQFQMPIGLEGLSQFQWHAHEMLYGYGMAVVAGFLLTAVKNWTGLQTIEGLPLAALFLLWGIARILWMFGTSYIWPAAIFDLLFNFGLIVAISRPIVRVKQWRQMAIVSKIVLLTLCHIAFYAAILSPIEGVPLIHWGLYGALYLVIALVLTMGRRVLPFFIERGVGYPVSLSLTDSKWLDYTSLALLLAFFISEMLFSSPLASSLLALGIFVVNAVRLIGWHTWGIWEKSLLWGLYLAFWFIPVGFLLFALSHFIGISKLIAIHAMTVGAIGLVTLAMMSRVSLGHTGRGLANPPVAVDFALGLLLASALTRVLIPLIESTNYTVWIGISQILWILSFFIFTLAYLPILARPRTDGKPG